MHFQTQHFPLIIILIAWTILFFVLSIAYRALKKSPPSSDSVIVSCVLLALLWGLHVNLSSGMSAGMHYHLLGGVLILLITGLPMAIFLLTSANVIYAALFQTPSDILVTPIYAIVVLIPVLFIGTSSLLLARLKLPHHLFIFIFINAFFTAALSMITGGVLSLWVQDLILAYPKEVLWKQSFPVLFLLSWGEAFFTGIITSIMISFAPNLLYYYSDEIYLPKRKSLF
ncbi:MAG: energy-coupling factor ABC transporter permease [Neisseriaceae bacterium]|nr:energy-coupling factor ABC transporter permease [Neisseriaceae bacterium]